MVVLALDTTSAGGSCAVARDDVVLVEQAGDAARPHDGRLPRDLMMALDAAGVTLGDIDVYAVATGPGSFTGLRIGIATMQGLAFATNRPLVGVSAFDALAQHAPAGRRVATWVDAWRGEVYASVFEEGVMVSPPSVEPPDRLLGRLRGRQTFFIGDGAARQRELIGDIMGPFAVLADPAAPLLAGAVARLAAAAAASGRQPPPHAIRPLYVRRPDAELARDVRRVC